jgi:superfamily II DNA or RNA helicase
VAARLPTHSRSPDPELAAGFARTRYPRSLRRYQRLALDAFERGRDAGQRRAYLVLPPGAGKTVLGLEAARRLGRRTLVLTPNTAVQAQWLRQWQDFQPAVVAAGPDPALSAPLTVLTYQALCYLDADDTTLDERAHALWRQALQDAENCSEDEADALIAALAAGNRTEYRAALAGYRQRARTLVARGGTRQQLLALLHPHGQRLIAALQAAGPCTLVLDECHHLLEMWGYLVRAVVEELGAEAYVLGLTATPPGELDGHAAELYDALFGAADFEVPTPAVVREGDLAPYQELAYLTLPLPHEREFVAAQHARFQALLGRLLEPEFGSTSFVVWVRRRVEERRGATSGARISWARFSHDHPALALAALRFLHHHRLDLPEGVRLGEPERQPPTADDWVALIEDYCRGCLGPSAEPRDAAAWQEVRAALPALGYVLTRQGVRAHLSPVDRVLALSASKSAAALTILHTEEQALGARLRALVLCDYERASGDGLAKLRDVLDPEAGSAGRVLRVLLADPAVARLEPVLVTGSTVACARSTAIALSAWIEEQVPALRGALGPAALLAPAAAPTAAWDDAVAVAPAHPWWQPRHYVPLVTRYFEEGRARCLIGTRALLGEGWDAPCVNVLIDLTTAGTRTAVHQMRGRSLRLDPALPRKVADNWDVVCLDPDHPNGAADYLRAVRKHRHYYAPTLDGEIESGISHVHPRLSPYCPPAAADLPTINAAMLARALDREGAYARWAIGTPYANAETYTVRTHFGRAPGVAARRLLAPAVLPGGAQPGDRAVAAVTGAAAGLGIAGLLIGAPVAALAGGLGVAGGLAWRARGTAGALRQAGPADTLEAFAAAVAEALWATAAIAGERPPAVRVVAQADGYYRCALEEASAAESAAFAEALDEVLAPLAAPRYVVPRYVADRPDSALSAAALGLRLALVGGRGARVVYHAVPAYLAANRERVAAFARAWHHHVSPGEPLYGQDPRAQGILAVQRGADPFAVTSQIRALWR